MRHLVEVEVVGDDLPLQRAGELDQFEIDLADLGKVHVRDHHLDARHLLNLLQDVEAAPAPVPFHRVRRVRDELKLLEHELRNHERAVHESGLAHIRDAAVDDDARVEHLVTALRAGRAEERYQPRWLEPLAAATANHHAEVGQRQQDQAVQKHDPAAAEIRPVQGGADRLGNRQPDRAAEQRAEHVGDGGVLEPDLEADNQGTDHDTEQQVRDETAVHGLELMCRIADSSHEEKAREHEPRHDRNPQGQTPDAAMNA